MKNIFRIIKIARPLYHLIAISAVLIILYAILELVSPLLSKLIVDEITAKINNRDGDYQRLIFLIILTFLIGFFSVLINSVSQRVGDHLAGRFRKLLTEIFYNKVLSLPQSYFDSEVSGKIINQLNRGIFTIYNFINTATNFFIPTFLQSVFTLFVMFIYNVPIAIFTFCLYPIYIFLSYISTRRWGKYELVKNKIEDESRGRLHEVIFNIKLVKSYNAQKYEFDYISKNLTESNKIYARQSKEYHIFDFLRNLSLNIILMIINFIIFINSFFGKMSFGEMILIIQLLNQVRRPLFAMSFILTNIQNAESGAKEFFDILELPSLEQYQQKINKTLIKNPEIEFKQVSFSYNSVREVLHQVSFKLGNYEKIAFVGHSGAGKTTIVNLILKFYEPTEGEIFLNKQSYRTLSHNYVRQQIALVFQESELFSSTVRQNVAYGRQAREQEIITALKQANAYNFVKKLPNGLDTSIGERGVKLSGGQRQRLQIARAILKNSPILILDEATSSLDAQSEREVQEALTNLMRNKLVLIIAHRFSTIQNVDKIIVVDEGRIVDSGPPRDLAQRPGIYRDLLHYQIEGNKKLLEKYELY